MEVTKKKKKKIEPLILLTWVVQANGWYDQICKSYRKNLRKITILVDNFLRQNKLYSLCFHCCEDNKTENHAKLENLC